MTPVAPSTDEALALSAELAGISRLQYHAMLKASVVQMCPEESSLHNLRSLRIAEICERLHYLPEH